MRRMFTYCSLTSLLLTSHLTQADELSLASIRCFPSAATTVTAYTSFRKASSMTVETRYRAPTTSPRLETLDVLSVGVSLDVFRQGQVWQKLQEQSAKQPESLHVGSVLPMDPTKYPVTSDDKNMAWTKRIADALELGLRDFMEKWPIPTITVVRDWDPKTPNLRFRPERTQRMLI
ncbi:type VI lipase adapter Tla3 domain-containing protein, partial [Pseudomonas protegens]